MQGLSSTHIASLLAPYYFVKDQTVIERIEAYIALLLEWNKKISLTRITEPVEIVKFHFGESLFAASILKISDGRLADVGSGAGFPGLPLAMAMPLLQVILIEANARRAAFLSEAVRRLDLANVMVLRSRMEDVESVRPFDFICARAIGKHANLILWSSENLTPRGRIVLFVGEGDIETVRKTTHWNWAPAVRIPDSLRRFVLSGIPLR